MPARSAGWLPTGPASRNTRNAARQADGLPGDVRLMNASALLMALIGVPAFGLLGLHVADNRYADPVTVAFGCGIMAWILVQLFFIPFFFLQPLVFVLGLTLALVAWSRMRDRTEVVDDQPPVG